MEYTRGSGITTFGEYVLYVPDNIDENTSVLVFEHGNGGRVQEAIDYASSNPNQIIIAPRRSNTDSDFSNPKHYEELMSLVDSVREKYNITNYNITSAGHSSGGYYGLAMASTNVETHSDTVGPQIVYMLDDYGPSYQYPEQTYNNLHLDNLKNSNSIMFFVENPSKYDTGEATYYAEQGINVIRIKYASGKNVHSEIKANFFNDGFAGFSEGNTTLPTNEKYTYMVYNKDTHNWETINVNEIDTLDKVYNYFGISGSNLQSDRTYQNNLNLLNSLLESRTVNTDAIDVSSDLGILLSNVNNVFASIKGASIVSKKVSLSSGSSTTSVPSQIPGIVNSYCGKSTTALYGLATALKQIEDSGYALDNKEKEIANDADTLNDEANVPNNVPKDTGSNPNTPNPNTPAAKPNNPIPTKPKTNEPTSNKPKQNNDEPSNWREYFPEYDEIYSTDDKLVFDYNNEFKVIVHRDGETITGIEYYYDFGSSDNAANSLFKLKSIYENSGVENIMMDDRYVKVIFNDSMFNNLSVSDFRNKYSNLNEIVK